MAVPLKDKFFVLLQFLFFLLYLWDLQLLKFNSPMALVFSGFLMAGLGFLFILMALIQLNTQISPFPSPRRSAKLVTSGVFSVSRHPIYTGAVLMAFGIGFVLGSGYKLVISIALFIVFFFKSKYEEERLLGRFPHYGSYKSKTGRFFPKFKALNTNFFTD